jgi:hypothetical protein
MDNEASEMERLRAENDRLASELASFMSIKGSARLLAGNIKRRIQYGKQRGQAGKTGKEIPKIIHYCWFGGKPLPERTQGYIKTWKEKCSGYEFMMWDENNFDVNTYDYTKEAYEKEKWAFVSDVCRLEKLYEFGGIYLDVNTEILQSFDRFLDDKMFVGFEQNNTVAGCIFGAKRHHPFIKKMIGIYKHEHLINEQGKVNLKTINSRMQEQLVAIGMKPKDSFQKLRNITVYPKEYFCPRYWNSSEQDPITLNTYSIHYFAASWQDEEVQELLRQQREDTHIDSAVS